MKYAHTYTASISIGGDTPTWEGEVTYGFNIQPAEPETGPTYDCGGTPGSEACVIDLQVLEIDGKRRPWNDYFSTDAELEDRFLMEADAFEGLMLEAALCDA